MDIREIKNELRREYLGRRRALEKEERITVDREICRVLSACEDFQKAQTVLAYAPKEPEIDIFPLIHSALAMGKRVAFPRCEKEYSLSFYYASPEQLSIGHFGILEPTEDMPLCQAPRDSLCLVPALLFDEEGYRLGYGKGYYDRFLAGFTGSKIGLCYSKCVSRCIFRNWYDKQVDCIITDNFTKFIAKS